MTTKNFPHYKQLDSKDCGPTCLKIIAKHYGRIISLKSLRKLSETTRLGSNLNGLSDAAEAIGFKTLKAKISLKQLFDAPLPLILFWNKRHFVVLYKIRNNIFYVSDPAHGLVKYNRDEFLRSWMDKYADEFRQDGIVLLLDPTHKFYENDNEIEKPSLKLSFLSKYILKYRPFIWQLFLGLLAGSILQLIFPFLTQSIVDVGIRNQDINFVYLILIAQLSLFIGRSSVEVIRSWILLHLSSRINISLVSDFFIKLMNLPISFFDTRITGDILQRINDHTRIENLLTISSLNVLFSLMSLLIFGIVLAIYNILIFLIFLIGTILYFIWVSLFLKKRADLDYKRFAQVSQEQSKVIELINGMQTIKLNNAEKTKRWGWELLQVKLYKISIENLTLEQYQSVGSNFINELKNILITVLSAKLVIDGEITLGMMLAISYIVGQLNAPVGLLIGFIREFQDAKISIERLAEIHNMDDEENTLENKINEFKSSLDIKIENVSFRYSGAQESIFENLSLSIPENKITAIVGVSGSGKTTLLKILLKFYDSMSGEIRLGNHKLRNISQKEWRKRCGVVMQEDYIFNDTIANNIAVGVDEINIERLNYSVDVANIREFVEELPFSYNTKIGMEGVGLSTGQKQRILIARAVYKNPDYLFLDEATSSLDANNEKVIMERLNTFFLDRTVVVIAHRLSTVKNAHQIVVLDKGKIAEIGTHKELINKKANYYNLVKNQLELGN